MNDSVAGIGARVLRREDFRFIKGRGKYVDDMVLPRQTYAVMVRSPHAHAGCVCSQSASQRLAHLTQGSSQAS